MQMIKLLLVILLLTASAWGRAQSRFAMDFNSMLDDGFFSWHFCPVFAQTFYVKTGVSAGVFGRGYIWKSKESIAHDGALVAPYESVNSGMGNGYALVDYETEVRGWALESGIGKFWALDNVHTLRLDIQGKWYQIREKLYAGYTPQSGTSTLDAFRKFEFRRHCFSIGPEVFHAIRLSGRLTFFYGIKFPVYFPVKTAEYKALNRKDITVGIQPNLAIGISVGVRQIFCKRGGLQKES